MLHDNGRALGKNTLIGCHNAHERLVGLRFFELRVVCNGLGQLEVGIIASIILQHIKNEALLDGLLH